MWLCNFGNINQRLLVWLQRLKNVLERDPCWWSREYWYNILSHWSTPCSTKQRTGCWFRSEIWRFVHFYMWSSKIQLLRWIDYFEDIQTKCFCDFFLCKKGIEDQLKEKLLEAMVHALIESNFPFSMGKSGSQQIFIISHIHLHEQ